MIKRKNNLKRVYGEWTITEEVYDNQENPKDIKHTIQVYRWESGRLTIQKDNITLFVIDEKDFINGINKLSKVN
jgi:hypothetical protein